MQCGRRPTCPCELQPRDELGPLHVELADRGQRQRARPEGRQCRVDCLAVRTAQPRGIPLHTSDVVEDPSVDTKEAVLRVGEAAETLRIKEGEQVWTRASILK